MDNDERAYAAIEGTTVPPEVFVHTPTDEGQYLKELWENAVQMHEDNDAALWSGFVVERPEGFVSKMWLSQGEIEYANDIQLAQLYRGVSWVDFWRNFQDAELIPVKLVEWSGE